MKIDANLIEEIRETADWMLVLPEKLVSAVLKPQEEYLRRRERIRRLKEIVELREIGKTIQQLYFFKGSIIHWVQEIQSEQKADDIKYVRELFEEIANGIEALKDTLAETSLSDTSLGAEASMFLSRAALAHRRLAALPEEALLNDRAVIEIVTLMERLTTEAGALIEKLDEHRKVLDYSYGD